MDIFGSIVNFFQSILEAILSLFPHSPFRAMIESFEAPAYLKWFAWFFPIKNCLAILVLWLAAISAFYLYSIVARWVKLLGD